MILLLIASTALGAPDPGEAVIALADRLVEEVGPRPAGSEAAVAAQRWVAAQLEARGWTPRVLPGPHGVVLSCRDGLDPGRTVALFAHTDSAHAAVPGANDNAAAVAVLLQLATALDGVSTPRRLCLVFPDAEEIGLRGSLRLAREPGAWLGGSRLDQVVSLDLVGRGRLTHNGLGPPFGARRLRALLGAAPAQVPWVYRGLSHAAPWLERSDHRWFTELGVPSSHLMARAEGGVLFRYHTADDRIDGLSADTLTDAVAAVLGIATAPPLPEERPGGAAFVIPGTAVVVPGVVTWLVLGLSPLLAGAGIRRALQRSGPASVRGAAVALAVAAAAALGAIAALALAGGGADWHLARAAWVVPAGWGGLAAVALAAPVLPPEWAARGLPVGISLGLAVGLALAGAPLLALPCAVSSAAIGLDALVPRILRPALLPVALWPALYLVRPDAVRELAHHQMVPAHAIAWGIVLGVLGCAALPWIGGALRQRRRLALALLAGAGLAVAGAWITPVQVPPYVRGPVYLRPSLPPQPP